jgi:hypothetical protein
MVLYPALPLWNHWRRSSLLRAHSEGHRKSSSMHIPWTNHAIHLSVLPLHGAKVHDKGKNLYGDIMDP